MKCKLCGEDLKYVGSDFEFLPPSLGQPVIICEGCLSALGDQRMAYLKKRYKEMKERLADYGAKTK